MSDLCPPLVAGEDDTCTHMPQCPPGAFVSSAQLSSSQAGLSSFRYRLLDRQ